MQFTSGFGRGLAAAGLIACLGAAGTSAASASPSNAPASLSGNFTCPGGVTGTFVVNSGKAAPPTTTWSSAHLTFTGGGTGIFVPTALQLTTPEGTENFTKGSAPGSVTCSITAPLQPPFFLTGTVIGNIIPNG